MGAFGERLKREREKRKITLDEVAQATKISTRFLRAIEEEKFDLLPGGIFNKGFVRSYANHLGLNAEEAVADYTEAYNASHPQESTVVDPEAEGRKILEQRVQRAHRNRPRLERIPWGKATIALLLFALGFALWGSYSRTNKPQNDVPVQKQEAVKPVRPSANVRTLPKSQPTSTASQATSATDQRTPATASVNTQNANDPGSFDVAIRAHEDSWIHITADGKDLLEDTLPADSQKSVRANSQVVIKAGNIGALDFWFNGQKLPAQGDLDQVKTVTFDSAGLVNPTPKVQPSANTLER